MILVDAAIRWVLHGIAAFVLMLGQGERLARDYLATANLSVPIEPRALNERIAPEYYIVGERPSDDVYLKCAPAIGYALSRLPRGITAGCVERVVVVSNMRAVSMASKPLGETERGATIGFGTTIVVDARRFEASDAYRQWVIQSVSTEWSRAVLRKHWNKLDLESWGKALPVGFKYGGDLKIAADPFKGAPAAELLKRGFITERSTGAQLNDFAVVSASLFEADPNLWLWYDSSELLRRKMNVAMRFYQSLDPTLTKEHFRGLAKRGNAPGGRNENVVVRALRAMISKSRPADSR